MTEKTMHDRKTKDAMDELIRQTTPPGMFREWQQATQGMTAAEIMTIGRCFQTCARNYARYGGVTE